MKSDSQFYKIFHDNPNLLPELLPIEADQGYTYETLTIKEIQRHLDGIARSKHPDLPIYVVEFQVKPVSDVVPRIVLEVSALQLEHPKRSVRGLIVYMTRKSEILLTEWDALFTCKGPFDKIYLVERLAQLPADHPLVCTFAPFVEEDPKTIVKNADAWYRNIHNNPTLSPEGKATLERVFTSWISQIFHNRTAEEVRAMIDIEAEVPLEETVFYKAITGPLKQELAMKDQTIEQKDRVANAVFEHGSVEAAAKALGMTVEDIYNTFKG